MIPDKKKKQHLSKHYRQWAQVLSSGQAPYHEQKVVKCMVKRECDGNTMYNMKWTLWLVNRERAEFDDRPGVFPKGRFDRSHSNQSIFALMSCCDSGQRPFKRAGILVFN